MTDNKVIRLGELCNWLIAIGLHIRAQNFASPLTIPKTITLFPPYSNNKTTLVADNESHNPLNLIRLIF